MTRKNVTIFRDSKFCVDIAASGLFWRPISPQVPPVSAPVAPDQGLLYRRRQWSLAAALVSPQPAANGAH